MKRLILIAAVGLVAVTAFLAFRPDTLFFDNTVDESLGEAFADIPAPSTTTTTVLETAAGPPPTVGTSEAPEASEPSVPVAVLTGGFYGIDHAASGAATVYEQDGRYVLRFEDDTDIQNGPDLYVWVLAADDYDPAALDAPLDLGKLKGNIGGQNYELPEGFDPSKHRSVLIWCERFGVPFAAVALAAP